MTAPPPGRLLVVSRETVRATLPIEDCVELMEQTLRRLATGSAQVPVRSSMPTLAGRGVLALMPAEIGRAPRRGADPSGLPPALGYKAVSVFPGNRAMGQPSHQAVIALHDPATGRITALVDGTEVTEVRTAAVSAVATRALARRGASRLAVLGAGAQARSHLRALAAVLPIDHATIWSRSEENARKVAVEEAAHLAFPIEVATSPPEAARDADVIVTATSAREPVLGLGAVRPGTHVNAVGSCFPDTRELDGDLVAAASVFVDDRAAAMVEAGDLLLAMRDGLVDASHVRATLGEVLAGRHPGRTSGDELTVFESLGLGIEDVAAAALVVERALATGLGTMVDL